MQKILYLGALLLAASLARADELSDAFRTPPNEAKPRVLWMWMGSNVSKAGIKRDLVALKEAGYSGTTLFSLADTTSPWAGRIANSPTPDVVAFSKPWWDLVRYATSESRRLGLDFGIHNCAGYESSGGPWITPELSMQQVVWSQKNITGPLKFAGPLERPQPDLRAPGFPVYNGSNDKVENPEIPARRSFFRDIVVLAMPAQGIVAPEQIIDLSSNLKADGTLEWDAPAGEWAIYRFGATTTGALLQPAQWEAIGLECDKMSAQAVAFHVNHVIADARKHMGNLVGHGLNYLHFDSYEAGEPSWTPKMREEFRARHGYELTQFLPTMANRIVGNAERTQKFRDDFKLTVRDLYRDNYFPTIKSTLHAAGLEFMCEPYGGPWDPAEVVPQVDRIVTEFWTNDGNYSPYELAPTVAAVRKAGRNLIEAEAFTGQPRDSQWTETPNWLKPIGDTAFCEGVNRMILHRFPHQPFDDKYQPGVAMGQWGTHFERTQTWWEPGKAWVKYLSRCQALLQWGDFVPAAGNNALPDFSAQSIENGIALRSIHRRRSQNQSQQELYFVANISRQKGAAQCAFAVGGRQPELWNPVTGTMRMLTDYRIENGQTIVPLRFDAAQSFFVVFRKPITTKTQSSNTSRANFPTLKPIQQLNGAWQVSFDTRWGGPTQPVTFTKLEDWTAHPENGIKYFSGTATYRQSFDFNSSLKSPLFLDLGKVRELARVKLNGRDLGVVWCAPWGVEVPAGLLKATHNTLEIAVTNVWANRLIGDEQYPADMEWNKGFQGFGGPLKAFPDWFVKNQPRPSQQRYTFSTWNYFTKSSPLVSSGLLGPVTLQAQSWQLA
ncbi:hypothetical protein EON83_17495 [bacterium]|nr:MAG: hypothetical protein EON83_17495 [bacterium]